MKRPKNKIIGFVVLAVLVVGTAVMGYYVNAGSHEILAERKTLANLKQEAVDMETLAKQFNDLKPKITEIGKTIPATTVDIASFLQDVNASASISGATVIIKVSDNKQQEKSKEPEKVQVELIISGSYVNTTRFVKRVSDLPYYFTLKDLTIKPVNPGTLETSVHLELVTAYHET